MDMSISLDTQRITDILALLQEWCGRKACTLRQLQQLIGILSWAAQVADTPPPPASSASCDATTYVDCTPRDQ